MEVHAILEGTFCRKCQRVLEDPTRESLAQLGEISDKLTALVRMASRRCRRCKEVDTLPMS